MSFIIADGFDDRWNLNNGDGFGDYYDGWGLYDGVWFTDYTYPGIYQGNREIGRYGGWCLALTEADADLDYTQIESSIPSGKNWSGGIALRTWDEDGSCVRFENATKSGPMIEFNEKGMCEIWRSKAGSGREVVARSDKTSLLTFFGWHYVTFETHVGDAGSDYIKVWVDGDLVIDESSLTLNFGGAVDSVCLPYTLNECDDIWLKNNTSTIQPEVRVLAMFPDAAGDDTECAPVGSASNYLNVNKFEQDFDDTYNLVDAGEKDSFEMGDITEQVSAGVAHALVARFFVKGDAGNTEDIRPYVIVNSNKYNGSAQTPVEGRYTYIQEIWETNPNTSVAWTLADLDAVQIGYEAV